MRKQKIFALFLCLLILALVPVSASAQKAKKVTISYDGKILSARDVISVVVGGTIPLTAEDPDGYESSFIWTSGSEKIATVTDGDVEGIKKGLTTITAMSESKSAKFTVRVRVLNTMVTNISILLPDGTDADGYQLVDKQSIQLKTLVEPAEADIKGVTWSVACTHPEDEVSCPTGKAPATISSSGKLTASGVTTATEIKVTATALDGSVTVGEAIITLIPRARRLLILDDDVIDDYEIELDGDLADKYHFFECVKEGETCTYLPNLTGKVAPIVKDLNSIDKYITLKAMLQWPDVLELTEDVAWSTSNKNIAEVDSEGRVTFYKAGTVTITAKTTDGSNLTATVKVTARIMVEDIDFELAKNKDTLAGGKSMKLIPTIIPSTATVKKIKWTSDRPGIASVNGSGVVKASKVSLPESVTITACATDADPRNQEVACADWSIMIYPSATSVVLYGETGEIVSGKTIVLDMDETLQYQLSATVFPSPWAIAECTWTSSNKKVATVDIETGEVALITPTGLGTTTITAKANDGSGAKASVKIIVRRLITDITIEEALESADPIYLRSGKTAKINVTGILPVDPSQKKLTWKSDDPTIATIKGNATSATVTAKAVTEERCTYVRALAADGFRPDGSVVESNEIEVCVYPAVKAIKIIADEDGETKDITKRTIYLNLGDDLVIGTDLDSQCYPDDSKGDADAVWSTGNKKILSYDGSSKFHAEKLGTTTIKVVAGDGSKKSATVNVKVVSSGGGVIYSAPDSNEIIGDPGSPDESSMLIPQGSDAPVVEELSGTVNAPIVEETMEETVTEAEGLRISGPEYAMPGESVQLSVSGEAEGAEVYWFSSSEETASVDAAGNVKVSENADLDTVLTITALLNDGEGTYAMHEIVIGELKAALPEGEENTETAEPAEEDLPTAEVEVITAEAEDAAEVEETPAEAEEVTSEAEETPAEGEEGSAETEVTPAEGEEPAAETEEHAAEAVETPSEGEEPAAEAEEIPAEAEEPVTETAVPAIEKIEADIENDLVTMTVGEQFTLESDKLNILPAEADWNTLSFKVENEYLAALESDEAAKIREDGLKLTALAAGETKLTVKAGDVEKVIRIVVEALPVVEEPVQETVVEEVTAPVVESVPEPDPEPVYEEPAAEEPAPEPEPEPVVEEPAPEPEPVQEEPQPAAEEAESAEE